MKFTVDTPEAAYSDVSGTLYRYRDGLLTPLELTEDDIIVFRPDAIAPFVSEDEMEYYLTVSPCPAEAISDRAEVNGGPSGSPVRVVRVGGGEFGSSDSPDDDGRWDAYA